MTRTTPCPILSPCILACVALGGCADPVGDESPPATAWDAFVAAHTQPLPDGNYLFEGDVAISEQRLRQLFDATQDGDTFSSVNSVDGVDLAWDAAQRLELTWCSALDFGSTSRNDRVAKAILDASAEWERATDVNYIYRFGENGAPCEPGAGGVLFRARLGQDSDCGFFGCPTAQSFFPNDPSNDPELLIWPEAFDLDDAGFMRIVRHELGHTLGLFHEHARFEQDETDFDHIECVLSVSDDWFALTPPDGKSVMGYPQCKGSIGSQQVLSAYDRLGVRYLYTLPRRFGRNEYFTFDGGIENDVFWYDPDGAWHLATASGAGVISFDLSDQCDYQPDGCSSPVANGLPFAVQWGAQYWAEDVAVYGRRDLPDVWLHNHLPMGLGFGVDPFVLSGWFVPLTGRFHDEERSDVFWYAPGGDHNVIYHANPDETATPIPVPPQQYLDPVVGDFGAGAGHSEIVMRDPIANTGYVWTSHDDHEFDITSVDFGARGLAREAEYIPLYGDFDADGHGDLLWYGPGPIADKLWFSNGTMANDVDVVDQTISGYYKPIVADFDGNGAMDVFWYGEGGRADALWMFKPGGLHRDVRVSIGGDYSPIAGNFNSGDWCADILWFAADLDQIIPWRSNCDGTFTQQAPMAVPANSFPVGYALGR